MKTRLKLWAATGLVLLLGATALAEDKVGWPQYRGPNRDGRSLQVGLLDSWPDGGPPVVWRTPLGEGYSAAAVVGDRVYTLFAEGKDEFAVSLNIENGSEIWRTRIDEKWKDMWGNGPRSTPTVKDGFVYALGARGVLLALDAATGEKRWRHDLWKEYRAKPPQWGVSTSPLVEGNHVLLDVGGEGGSSIVAFHRESGKEVWRSQEDKAGYSSPMAVTIAGKRQVVFLTGTRLVSLDPETGSALWSRDWKTSYDVNAATPVFVPPDRIFVSSGYDVGSEMLEIKESDKGLSAGSVWKSREMRNKFSSSVFYGGHMYGFDEKLLKCIDAGTGEMRWRQKGLGHGSLIVADGYLIVLSDSGELVLAEATPKSYKEKSRVRVLKGRSWTLPALLDGKLYLRDEKEMVVLDISDQGAQGSHDGPGGS